MTPFVRVVFLVFCSAASLPAQQVASPPAPETPPLRARLYEFAGVLGNEGFKLRDGFWSGQLEGARTRRLAVNLFAGNQYWFFAATSASAETPELSLRDPSGEKVRIVPSERGRVAAAGVTAPVTGRYLLEIGGSAKGTREFCVIYLFK